MGRFPKTRRIAWAGDSDPDNPYLESQVIEILDGSGGNVLGIRMSGKLHDADYQQFVPLIDGLIAQEEKVRLLAVFEDFHGWDMHALWDDIKFGATHCASMERIALVGETKWQKWMATVCKPFTLASIKYFDIADIDAAWRWAKSSAEE